MSANEKSIILLARPTCGYCEIAMPIIQKLAKILSNSNSINLSAHIFSCFIHNKRYWISK